MSDVKKLTLDQLCYQISSHVNLPNATVNNWDAWVEFRSRITLLNFVLEAADLYRESEKRKIPDVDILRLALDQAIAAAKGGK